MLKGRISQSCIYYHTLILRCCTVWCFTSTLCRVSKGSTWHTRAHVKAQNVFPLFLYLCFGFFSFVLRISLLSFSLLRDAFGKDEAVRTMLGPLSGVMIKRGARPQSTTAINNEFPGSGEVQWFILSPLNMYGTSPYSSGFNWFHREFIKTFLPRFFSIWQISIKMTVSQILFGNRHGDDNVTI